MFDVLSKIVLVVVCLCLVQHSVQSQDSQFAIGSIIRGFELPQTDADGNLKSKIRGDEALVVSANEVRIKGLTIELYTDDQVSTTITAQECTFWRMENRLTTDQSVRIKRTGLTLNAKGMDWHLTNSQGIFRNQVRVAVHSGNYFLQP